MQTIIDKIYNKVKRLGVDIIDSKKRLQEIDLDTIYVDTSDSEEVSKGILFCKVNLIAYEKINKPMRIYDKLIKTLESLNVKTQVKTLINKEKGLVEYTASFEKTFLL